MTQESRHGGACTTCVTGRPPRPSIVVGEEDWGVAQAEVVKHDHASGSMVVRLIGDLVDERPRNLSKPSSDSATASGFVGLICSQICARLAVSQLRDIGRSALTASPRKRSSKAFWSALSRIRCSATVTR